MDKWNFRYKTNNKKYCCKFSLTCVICKGDCFYCWAPQYKLIEPSDTIEELKHWFFELLEIHIEECIAGDLLFKDMEDLGWKVENNKITPIPYNGIPNYDNDEQIEILELKQLDIEIY